MLLQFSIRNYKTFKNEATLSLYASNYDKVTLEEDNIFAEKKYGFRLLKSAVIYGANASGKSNFLDALSFMRFFVINSSKKTQNGEQIEVQPFRLSDETENEPSEFEVIFLLNDVLYRYGFEVTQQKVVSEWLYYKPKTKEIELFFRKDDKYEIHERNFTKGGMVVKEGLVRDNALLLSVAAQFNDVTANAVLDWFKHIKVIFCLQEYMHKIFSMNQITNPVEKLKMLELLKVADLGIQDIKPLDKRPNIFHNQTKDEIVSTIVEDVITKHKKYDSNKNEIDTVSFLLSKDESSGTEKFFSLSWPILNVIENGYILAIDEFDAQLHPNLVRKIVSLFNSKDNNEKNAQLIFNTQNTNLLSPDLFRRDQIWFTDKNKYGEAKLYSLADFKTDEVRKNERYEENYIKGKYGAVPFLGFFDNLKNILSQHEDEK